MNTVGIIANPASGKDIRRLIAQGSVFDNNEKVSIVRRVMLGLESAGVERVVYMPDYFGIGRRALDGVKLKIEACELQMRVHAGQEDSTLAARLMRDMGVGAVVTLGGDGTNRAVAKEIGEVPIMPISTGTNNVFPTMIEGTVAGLAAGYVATHRMPEEEAVKRHMRLEVVRGGEVADIALVDAVVYVDAFIASRAIWDMSRVRAITLTHASPSAIGLSSIGGGLYCAHLDAHHGLHIRLNEGPGLLELTAPIAPGLMETVHITGYRLLEPGDEVPVCYRPSILALDGEREVIVAAEDEVTVRLSEHGPRVIDLQKTLKLAAQLGLQLNAAVPQPPAGGCYLHAQGLCTDPPQSCSHWEG